MNIISSKVLSLLLTFALTAMSLSGCSRESTAVPGNSKIEYNGEVKIVLYPLKKNIHLIFEGQDTEIY